MNQRNRGCDTSRGDINRQKRKARARNVKDVPPKVTPSDSNDSENKDNRPIKKGQRQAMNTWEKLVLICKCYVYVYDYKPRNKLAF